MSDRAKELLNIATNKRPSNYLIENDLAQTKTLLQKEQKRTIQLKNLFDTTKQHLTNSNLINQELRSDLKNRNATIQALNSELNNANATIQDLQSDNLRLTNNQRVTKDKKKNKQRAKPCIHGNNRSAR